MFHRLVHLPSASPIEVHRRTLVGDPQLLVPSRLPTSGSTTNRRPRPVPLRSRRTTTPGSHGERPVVPRYRSLRVLPDQRGPPGPAKVRLQLRSDRHPRPEARRRSDQSARSLHTVSTDAEPAALQHAALQHPRVIELLAGAGPPQDHRGARTPGQRRRLAHAGPAVKMCRKPTRLRAIVRGT